MTETRDQAGGTPATWDCEAYGPEGTRIGALCFLAGELGERVCRSEGECGEQVGGERRRVFRRINELAAAGRPDFEYLAEQFTSPDQLLGGPGDDQQPPEVPRFYYNPSAEERAAEARRPFRTPGPSTPTRVGFRVFGDDGRHPAEVEGWTPPAAGGHRFLPGGDDATFGAAGTWCAVWVRTAGGPDQCGRPPEVHPPDGAGAVSLAEAMKKATEDPSYGVARLECAPDVVGFLRSLAPDEPPSPPWQPAPIVPLGSVPVVGDDSLPAGRWRMVDAAGAVVWEGAIEWPARRPGPAPRGSDSQEHPRG